MSETNTTIDPISIETSHDSVTTDDSATSRDTTKSAVQGLRSYITDITNYDAARTVFKELRGLQSFITKKFPPLKKEVIVIDSEEEDVDTLMNDAKDEPASRDGHTHL
jgi:hypothetical protein